jgi:hypothetical protein
MQTVRNELLTDNNFQVCFKTVTKGIKDNRVLRSLIKEIEESEGDENVKKEMINHTVKLIEENKKERNKNADLLEEIKKLEEKNDNFAIKKSQEKKWIQEEIKRAEIKEKLEKEIRAQRKEAGIKWKKEERKKIAVQKKKTEQEAKDSFVIHKKNRRGELYKISDEIERLNESIKGSMVSASNTKGRSAFIITDYSKSSPEVVAELLDRYKKKMCFQDFPRHGEETRIDSFIGDKKSIGTRVSITRHRYKRRYIRVGTHFFNSLFENKLRDILEKNFPNKAEYPHDGWIINLGKKLLLVIWLQQKELMRRGLPAYTSVKVIKISPVKDRYSYTYKVDNIILDNSENIHDW